MRTMLSICSSIAFIVATASPAAPPSKGGGGGGAVTQFDPEITYKFVGTKGSELRFASRDGSSEILVHSSAAGIYSHDLSSQQAKLIAYTGPDGVFLRQWQASPLKIGLPQQIYAGVAHFVDFSPDDTKLLFSTGSQLYIHDIQSGVSTLVLEAGVIANPRWSPTGSGDIFFFGGGVDQSSAWDLRRYSAASGSTVILRYAGDGFVGQLGMDVTRPQSSGAIYEEPRLVLAFETSPGSIKMRLFGLDGALRESPDILGNSFHFDCTNARVVHHLEQGRNDAIGITSVSGTTSTWKKDSRIRTHQTDWLRRVPCQ